MPHERSLLETSHPHRLASRCRFVDMALSGAARPGGRKFDGSSLVENHEYFFLFLVFRTQAQRACPGVNDARLMAYYRFYKNTRPALKQKY